MINRLTLRLRRHEGASAEAAAPFFYSENIAKIRPRSQRLPVSRW